MNRIRTLGNALALSAFCGALCAGAADETVTFVPPHAETTSLVNSNADGTTTYDESAYSVTEENALAFAGFEAVAGSTSRFLGGWWNFGLNTFFLPTAGRRTVTIDGGARIHGIGNLKMGAGSGLNANKLVLAGTSSVTVAQCLLGTANVANENNEIWITDGSCLTCTNYLSFSDANVCKSEWLSGNKLIVSNANSRLVVKSATYMDRTQGSYNGGVGGGHLIVTDGARAELQGLNIAVSGAHSKSNRVTVARGGVLTTTGISLGTSWYSSGRPDYTTIEVLDGGAITNTGAISWGYGSGGIAEHHSTTLFVSNGTFISKATPSGSKPRLCVGSSTVRLSGPKTVFRFSDKYDCGSPFFAASPGDNTIILENGAQITLPIHYGFSYTGTSMDNTIIVRTGAHLNQGSSSGCRVLMAGFNATKGPNGYRNKIFVESAATVTCWQVYANSVDGFFGISNATVNCVCDWTYSEHAGFFLGAAKNFYGNEMKAGYGYGTNMVLALSGTAPKLNISGSRFSVDSTSTICFDLPPEGYPSAAQPLIYVRCPMKFHDTSCSFAFTGTAEMLAYHAHVLKRKARYLLIDAESFVSVDDAIAAAQAKLPERMTLEKVTSGGRTRLYLNVRPRLGTRIYLR